METRNKNTTSKQKRKMITVENITYYSLYEHLGVPAGGELGGKVYKAAKNKLQKVQSQMVKGKKYNGSVLCYTKEFLDNYFELLNESQKVKVEEVDPLDNLNPNNDLPF